MLQYKYLQDVSFGITHAYWLKPLTPPPPLPLCFPYLWDTLPLFGVYVPKSFELLAAWTL